MDFSLSQIICMSLALIPALCWGIASATRHERPVWHSPCSTGNYDGQIEHVFQNLGEPETEDDIKKYQRQLMFELNDARMNARRLDHYIIRKRLYGSSLLIQNCRSYSTLLGMPQIEVTHELVDRDFHTTLPYDFHRLATLAVFIDDISKDTYGYQNRLDSLLVHIRKSLCLMEIVALSRQQTINRDVTEQTMPSIYRNLNDGSVRDMRNCIIVRDAAELFDNLHEWYSQWI